MKSLVSSVFLTLLSVSCPSSSAEPQFSPREFADFERVLTRIRYPAEDLIQALLKLDPKSRVVTEIIPHGRSFERTQTDFLEPRSVLVWKSGSTVAPYFLYLGFTPKAKQIEVIAWNWNTRQFDFHLVRDYERGKTARITPVYRPTCVACHQNGGPIFSQAPWSETTALTSIRNTLKEKTLDPLARYLLELPPSDRLRREASRFDLQVQTGAQLLQRQRICAEICAGDLDCRRGILLAALAGNITRVGTTHMPPALLRAMDETTRARFPKDAFSVVSHQILNRNLNFRAPLNFSEEQDPLRSRTLVRRVRPDAGASTLLGGYSMCWSFTPAQVETIRNFGLLGLESALNTEQMQSLVKSWPAREDEIISALRQASENPKAIETGRETEWPPPELSTLPPGPTGGSSNVNQLFKKYCASCHSGPGRLPPILPLTNLSLLNQYVGSARRTVKELLDPSDPIMPPKGAPQPTAEERRQMFSEMR
jgi:mono/diheme cytochrome c family protein